MGKSEYAISAQQLMEAGYPCALCYCHGESRYCIGSGCGSVLHSTTVHDPAKIRNIDAVSDLIWDHIYSGKKICIFGDYDADGIAGAAILYLALRSSAPR